MSDHTVIRAADVPDYTGDAPGAFLGYGRPLGSEQIAVNVRILEPGMPNVPPGGDPEWGHSHVNIEEIYFVLEGEIEVKLGDDVVTLGPRDAVLIPPSTPRATRNVSDATAALMMISRRVEDQASESRGHEGFWPGAGG